MAARSLLVLALVGVLAAFLVEAEDDRELDGAHDVKAFIKPRGGGIRLLRDLPPLPGKQHRRKTGEIAINIGKIRERNSTEVEDDNMQGQGPPQGQGPRRPRIDDLDDVDFDVRRES